MYNFMNAYDCNIFTVSHFYRSIAVDKGVFFFVCFFLTPSKLVFFSYIPEKKGFNIHANCLPRQSA